MVNTQYAFYGHISIAKLRKGQVLPFYLLNQSLAFNSKLALINVIGKKWLFFKRFFKTLMPRYERI